ncbi:ZN557 protein, partial [Erithacus rubecula]|nr:ZN557 protein [Erithacus rubecula]
MEPRVVLGPRHGALHRDVVQQSCTALLALEFSVPKPDLLSYLDREEEVTALDLHVSGDTPTAEHGAGAGQEEPAEEKPNTDKEHAQLPASRGETQAANTCSSAGTAALARHLQSHLRQKPFDCSQTFTRSCHLEQHLQSHLR